MSLPDITITELTNALGIVPPGSDDLQAIIGCSSSGVATTPAAYGTVAGLVADFGYGPMVEAAARSINETGTPVIVCKTPNSTPGEVGDIDVSTITGTALVSLTGV